VIEDEESIAAAIATRLRSEGYEVEIAGDGPPRRLSVLDDGRPEAPPMKHIEAILGLQG